VPVSEEEKNDFLVSISFKSEVVEEEEKKYLQCDNNLKKLIGGLLKECARINYYPSSLSWCQIGWFVNGGTTKVLCLSELASFRQVQAHSTGNDSTSHECSRCAAKWSHLPQNWEEMFLLQLIQEWVPVIQEKKPAQYLQILKILKTRLQQKFNPMTANQGQISSRQMPEIQMNPGLATLNQQSSTSMSHWLNNQTRRMPQQALSLVDQNNDEEDSLPLLDLSRNSNTNFSHVGNSRGHPMNGTSLIHGVLNNQMILPHTFTHHHQHHHHHQQLLEQMNPGALNHQVTLPQQQQQRLLQQMNPSALNNLVALPHAYIQQLLRQMNPGALNHQVTLPQQQQRLLQQMNPGALNNQVTLPQQQQHQQRILEQMNPGALNNQVALPHASTHHHQQQQQLLRQMNPQMPRQVSQQALSLNLTSSLANSTLSNSTLSNSTLSNSTLSNSTLSNSTLFSGSLDPPLIQTPTLIMGTPPHQRMKSVRKPRSPDAPDAATQLDHKLQKR